MILEKCVYRDMFLTVFFFFVASILLSDIFFQLMEQKNTHALKTS